MKIWSYTFSNADEIGVLPSALNSLSKFCDRMYLVDSTVEASMIQHPRHIGRLLADHLYDRPEYGSVIHSETDVERSWNGTRLIHNTYRFTNPGNMRNWCEGRMLQDGTPDWIVALDSDEIASHEMIDGIRPFLESLPENVTNVVQPWVTLVVDEQHMSMPYPDWLNHARIYKPRQVRWSEKWHEHQYAMGVRAHWDAPIIHTRLLFRNRLLQQRGHKTIAEGAWRGVMVLPLEDVATFDLEWPTGEPRGLGIHQVWGESVFGHLASYRVVLVSGPQRSGTRVCAKMIAQDTGFRYIDEVDFQVENKELWERIVKKENNIVVQCPSMTRYIDEFGQEDDVAVVWMVRPVDDIIKSQERISWGDAEETSLKKYGKTMSDGQRSCEVKYDFFNANQSDKIKHLYIQNYDDLRSHGMWLDSRDRRGFNWNQTGRELGVKIV